MLLMCVPTVRSLMVRRAAISALDSPCPNSVSTSSSRPVSGSVSRRQLRGMVELADHLQRDGRVQRRLPGRDLADRPQQFLRRRILEQVAQRPRLDGRKYLVVLEIARQHEDTGVGLLAGSRRWQRARSRPGIIRSSKTTSGRSSRRPVDCLLPVSRFANHLDVRLVLHQRTQPLAHDGMVVCNQQTDRQVAPPIMAAERRPSPASPVPAPS